MAKRLTAKRRSKYAEQQARSRTNHEYYERRKPEGTAWSRLTDHERAEWLRARARSV